VSFMVGQRNGGSSVATGTFQLDPQQSDLAVWSG
jgi:hypothetical protein